MRGLTAEIVSIGTELLLGQIVDTNATYLARRLSEVGVACYFRQTVGDNVRRAVQAVSLALERADVVLLVGGLGPTDDDVTRQVAASVVGVGLQEHPEALSHVESYFRRIGRPMTPGQRRQALVPQGARIIPNPVGTAPGFLWEGSGKILIALPGPPGELTAMVDGWVLPHLADRARQAGAGQVFYSRVLRFTGIGEAALEDRLRDLIASQSNPTLATYAGVGEVSLRITAAAADEERARALVEPVEQAVRERLGLYCYGVGDATLEGVVAELLEKRGLTLAIAESCTGGNVSDALTDIPGISRVLLETVVAYSNGAKVRRLGVEPAVLEAHGAVSEACARAMAEGVRRTAEADVGLGITGIAGPSGGSPEKPVGLVYVAAALPWATVAERHLFGGDRRAIKVRAARAALDLLRRQLLKGAQGTA